MSDWQSVRQQAHSNVLAYMSLMHPETVLGPQHHLFREVIDELHSRKSRFVCLSCPPRHSKSWTFSQTLPAWWLGNNPSDQVIATSYSADLAQSFGSKVRADMSSDLYGQIFTTNSKPSGAGTSGTDFSTNAGGVYKATGVGGGLTGFGGDLIVVDDPTKNAETADSPAYKSMLEKFFGETLYTRLMPNGVIVVMQTRWREDDLVGYILKSFPEWEYINIPAIVEDQDLGTRGALGRGIDEALWPQFFTTTDLNRTRKVLHEGPFQALYQGRPVSAKGGTLGAADIHWAVSVEDIPGTATPVHRLYSWDTALTTKQRSDYSVGTEWVILSNGAIWQTGYVRMRGTFPEVQAAITSCWEANDTGLPSTVVIEHSHMGIGLRDQLAIDRPEMSVELFLPGHFGGKLDRLQLTLVDWQSAKVYLSRLAHEDFPECLDELIKAGSTAHDDYLDSCTQAILWARGSASKLLNVFDIQILRRSTATQLARSVKRVMPKMY